MSGLDFKAVAGNALMQGARSHPPSQTLPTMYDLPSEYPEEPGLPDEFHDIQPQLLSRTLLLADYERGNCFSAADLNVYYDWQHQRWHKRPDWFLVVGVPRLYEGKELRRSYVTWQEAANPRVAVEFLSPSTERDDLGRFYPDSTTIENLESPDTEEQTQQPGKLEVYERYLKVPHYIVYSYHSQRLRYFFLTDGVYQAQSLQPGNCAIWLEDLGIGLGIWQGEFEEIPGSWLRWCDINGNWCLTDTEKSQAQLLKAAKNLLATGMTIEQI